MLLFIVSEPEGTLEISFLTFLILPLGNKASEEEGRGQGHRAIHRRTGHRVRLLDSRPRALAIKRRENNKNWCLLYFQKHYNECLWRSPLPPQVGKYIMI